MSGVAGHIAVLEKMLRWSNCSSPVRAALTAAISAMRAQQREWRPIATAPHGDVGPDEDFAMLLAANRRGGLEIINAMRADSAREAAAADDEPCWFTHWQPLPAAPSTEAQP